MAQLKNLISSKRLTCFLIILYLWENNRINEWGVGGSHTSMSPFLCTWAETGKGGGRMEEERPCDSSPPTAKRDWSEWKRRRHRLNVSCVWDVCSEICDILYPQQEVCLTGKEKWNEMSAQVSMKEEATSERLQREMKTGRDAKINQDFEMERKRKIKMRNNKRRCSPPPPHRDFSAGC